MHSTKYALTRRLLVTDALTRLVEVHRDRILLGTAVAAAVLFNLITLFPEFYIPVVSNNDDAFHYLYIQRASEALANGENVFDFWTPQLELGHATFVHYQNLPHLAIVFLHRALFGLVDLFTLFNLVRYLLLAALPVTVFWSARRMGLSIARAVFAGAASSLLSTPFLYGLDYASYVWRGFGTYTQIWGMHFSFIGFAAAHTVVAQRRGHLLAIVALSLLVLSHLLYAYIVALSIGVIFLAYVRRDRWRTQVRDLAIVGALTLSITAYMWLPFLQYGAYLNVSPYLQSEKYDGLGAPSVLGYLFRGELFDWGRLPILTLLLAIGIGVAVYQRTRLAAALVILFAGWLVLYFGRPTLGPLVDLMPLSHTLLIHRFSGAVHIFGILLIGVGAGALWDRACSSSPPWAPFVATAAGLVLMFPLMTERGAFYDQGLQWMRTTRDAMSSDADARAVVDTIRTLPRGRTFAGLRTDYGPQMGFGIPFNSARFSDLLVWNGLDVVSPPYNSSSLSSDLIWDFRYDRRDDYDLFNVRYVVMPATLQAPAFLTPITRTTRYTLYSAPTSGYTEWLKVGSRDAARGPADLVLKNRTWVLAADRTARGLIRWDYPATAVRDSALPPSCTSGALSNESASAARVSVVASCETPGTLLIKVTYDPGWLVTVDGTPTETFMLSPAYLGAALPSGSHRVIAEYTPVPTKTPLLGLGALLLAASVPISRRLSVAHD